MYGENDSPGNHRTGETAASDLVQAGIRRLAGFIGP
jgi:hypothetical protein